MRTQSANHCKRRVRSSGTDTHDQGTLASKDQKVAVHTGVIDLWESARNMTSTHNLIFETAGREVSAHEHMLLLASPVLSAMLQSIMKEG